MKPILVLIMAFCCQIAIAQSNTLYFDADWKAATQQNAVYYSIVNEAGGKYTRMDHFAKTKQLQMSGTYSTAKLDVKDGYFKWYYENGKPKEEGAYKNNIEEGLHIYYNENGTVTSKANFTNGELLGTFSAYFDSGKLKATILYNKDEKYHYIIYYREDGTRQSEGSIGDPGKNGIWKYYDEKGKISSIDTIKTEYEFAAAHVYMQLPNDEWYLFNKGEAKKKNFYVFKRQPVKDPGGREIIPAIIVAITNAKNYQGNIDQFAKDRSGYYVKSGAKIDQQLIGGEKDCPLKYKNARLLKASYTQNGMGHIMYLVYALTDDGVGIQMGMDMTTNISAQYEKEFIKAIASIKQLN